VAHSHAADDTTRRDFLYFATGAAGATGAALAAWPLIAQMNPAANVLALAATEVDISAVQPGQMIQVMWRGRPTFIRRLTPAEVDEASSVPVDDLIDSTARNANHADNAEATVMNRISGPEAGEGAEASNEWLIVVGVCTHLGCIPIFDQGEYDGWLCPCHGSQYDAVGRVRVGPAPENLAVPPYAFLSATRVRIG
jgi:ubiquinol-cytochrome c reductase iron-sulfur subunit